MQSEGDSPDSDYMHAFSNRLKDFDLDKGLKSLSGSVKLTVANTEVVRIAVEAGQSAAVPGGRLTVDSVTEQGKDEQGTVMHIALTVTPDAEAKNRIKSLDSLFERNMRCEGSTSGWRYLDLESRGLSFEIETEPLKRAPAWVELRARIAERVVDIPFQFTDAKLPKGKP